MVTPRPASSVARCSRTIRPTARPATPPAAGSTSRRASDVCASAPTTPVRCPHWTDPPTGEIPRLAPAAGGDPVDDESDEVDVWSTFTTESPVWRDDDENLVTGVIEQVPADFGPPAIRPAGRPQRLGAPRRPRPERRRRPAIGYDAGGDRDPSGELRPQRPVRPVDAGSGRLFDDADYGPQQLRQRREPSGSVPRTGRPAERGSLTGEVPLPPRREPGRITIGTDPSGMPRRPPDPRAAGPVRRAPGARSARPARARRPASATCRRPSSSAPSSPPCSSSRCSSRRRRRSPSSPS